MGCYCMYAFIFFSPYLNPPLLRLPSSIILSSSSPYSVIFLFWSLLCLLTSLLQMESELHISLKSFFDRTCVFANTAVLSPWNCDYFCIVEAVKHNSQWEETQTRNPILSKMSSLWYFHTQASSVKIQLSSILVHISETITCYSYGSVQSIFDAHVFLKRKS